MWSIALSINTVAEIESFGATMYAPWNFIPLNPVEFLEQEEAELLLITKTASTLGKNNHEIFMLFLSN